MSRYDEHDSRIGELHRAGLTQVAIAARLGIRQPRVSEALDRLGLRKQIVKWKPVVQRAAVIVGSYSTGVTLRQVFYRLVAEGAIPNTSSAYNTLGTRTAEARREGWFPDLVDTTRSIHRLLSFDGPEDARDWLRRQYRRDRTEGQECSVYVGVEKRALGRLLSSWFEDYGVPVLVLAGYASQSYTDQVRRHAATTGRMTVLIYAGDFDPSGLDIFRDFVERSQAFDHVEHVALTEEQAAAYPSVPAKAGDTRARAGDVQVELDAMPPDELRAVYVEAFEQYHDAEAYQAVLDLEEAEREQL